MAETGLAGMAAAGGRSKRSRSLGAGAWSRRRNWWATLALVITGPALALGTFFTLTQAERGVVGPNVVRIVLLVDLIYILAVAALVVWTIARAVSARRAKSAGSKLHLRLSGLFTLVALGPTVLVAVFATVTVNFGLEAWFSAQVRSVVSNALSVAEAYGREHRANIRGDALAMANDLNRAVSFGMDPGALGDLLRQQQLLRELPEAFLLDGDGDIIARGEWSYMFTLQRPTPEQFAAARAGEVVLIDDEANDQLRALVHLTAMIDSYLYITRYISGEVLALLDDTRDTVALYERLERERGRVLFDFALLYLAFALLVILAAVWLGLWFAERLAKPIGRLAAAAERVERGELDIRVKEERGDDEIALLSHGFNRMTRQLKRQREALLDAARDTERRRRFIETVLSGVSAGVVGLDADGRIELINGAAAEMLGVDAVSAERRRIGEIAPALAALVEKGRRTGLAQEQFRLSRAGRSRELMARVTPKADAEEGAVLTLDDLTELVAAQRNAAWGDVARRIAHEIKNPLTPIQLSADRLKRKFSKMAEEDRAALSQYADVIMRQAGDIRRMVDEFSKFARMPEPDARDEDLAAILRGAVLLQKAGADQVRFTLETPDGPTMVRCDRGLISQAVTNLLKNAAEGVEARLATSPEPPGEVRARLQPAPGGVVVEIVDNGVGLPETDRARLTEPYVTTRVKGTGLGLAIVKKIVEQHGGALALDDAPPFAEGAPAGAMARIFLPTTDAATPSFEKMEPA
ncbi:MAG: PAS domain-containing sensor histidine kinase [Rhodobacteraceae bacterium]|nr:MAG: PAS domain-containing sensor histidine kinase [Paracoccaceae bacterium]